MVMVMGVGVGVGVRVVCLQLGQVDEAEELLDEQREHRGAEAVAEARDRREGIEARRHLPYMRVWAV
eukprot:371982-Prymnesium_polylepis.1